MARKTRKRSEPHGVSDQILDAMGRIVPGFHGFFKKMEKSQTFGARVGEIRKEIERRFSGTKK